MQQIVNNQYFASQEALLEHLPMVVVPIDRQQAIEVLRENLAIQECRFAALSKDSDIKLLSYLRRDINSMKSTLQDFYKVKL